MADIRINALATTAASTASDDFIAVDGSANGTRKLNAYSPTFGGNLTVSGAGNFGGDLNVSKTQPGLTLANAGAGGATWAQYVNATTGAWTLDHSGVVNAITIAKNTAATTLSGNLTVSGTGNSSVAGTLLVATTTNSSNGKLQLADHNSSSGGIGFGTDTALYRDSQGKLRVESVGGGTVSGITYYINGTAKGQSLIFNDSLYLDTNTAGASIILRTGATTTALTLDSSQNATFAGKITANGAGSTFKGTATNDNAAAGYVGEYVTSTVASGSAVTLTNATAADITSISLTAGDWDISGNVAFKPNGSPTVSYYVGGAIATSAAIATDENRVQWADPSTSRTVIGAIPTRRVTIASTTTIYLTGYSEYTGGTNVTAYGRISARRVR